MEIVLVLVGIAAYFLPATIGLIRDHDQKWAILTLNLLLGWTGIGWIVALIWAVTKGRTDVGSQSQNVTVTIGKDEIRKATQDSDEKGN